MKRIIFITLCILLTFPVARADWVSLTGGSEGASPTVSLERTDARGVTVTVEIPGFYVSDAEMEGEIFQFIQIPEAARSLEIGAPEVPKISVLVAVPDKGSVVMKEISRTPVRFDGYRVAPMQVPTTDIDPDPAFVMNEKIYQTSYPWESSVLHPPAIRRDVRFVIVDIYPIIAHSADETIEAAKQITFNLEFTAATGINEKERRSSPVSYELDNFYRKTFLNYDALDLSTGYCRDEDDLVRYLIITKENFAASIAPLAEWWNRAGLKSKVIFTSQTGSTAAGIKAAIQDYYDNHGTEYVLFVGALTDIPLGNPSSWEPGDYNYQLLEGADDYADIALGRILTSSADVIDHVVARTLNFILDPPNDEWLNKSMLCAHEEQYPGKYTECKEYIRNFSYEIENFQYDTYYPPEGATGTGVKAAIEEGRVVVNYRGHGDNQEWSWSLNWKYNSDVYALQNGPYTPIVWNMACYCGNVRYSSECLSLAFQNAGSNGEGGAVANIGAIEPSYTIANHAFDKMVYRAPLGYGITRLGYTIDRGKQQMIVEEGSYGLSNSQMYLLFGDPAIDIHARELFTGDIGHLPTVTMGGGQFVVTVAESGAPIEGAMVCIMKENDELYEVGYTDAMGSVALPTLLTSGGTMQLTVTSHNMKPYLTDILVQAAGCGAVLLDKNIYNCSQTVTINLWDSDLNVNPGVIETAIVEISSESNPVLEIVTLTETGPDTGHFVGAIMTSATQSGQGYVKVSHDDSLLVVYEDEDCEGSPQTVSSQAGIDCQGPEIFDVMIPEISTNFFTVTWKTSEPSITSLTWGDSVPPENEIGKANLRTEHMVKIENIDDCTLYFFKINALDAAGNQAEDDNLGSYYHVLTYELVVMLESNMDTDPGWTYEGEWAWGQPTGQGGQYGSPDPTSGHTGLNAVGYNLNGDYPNSMSTTYWTTTQAFDCTEAAEVYLNFYGWLGVETYYYDHAYIAISNNNGESWSTIWENPGRMDGGSWDLWSLDITDKAAGYSQVKIRWGMGPTDSSWRFCGWNIDDVMVSFVRECTTVPTPTPAPTNTPTPSCINNGDVNQDGLISSHDAQLVFLIALGSYTPTYEEECAADCDGNGEISSADAQRVFMAAIGSAACVDPL